MASDLSDAELARFVVGAEREARRQGHGVLIGSIDRGGTDAERYLNMLLERRVDGILTAAPQMERDARIGKLLRGTFLRSASIVFWEADPARRFRPRGDSPARHPTSTRAGTSAHRDGRGVTRPAGHCYEAEGYEHQEAHVPYDPALVESGNWMADEAYRATIRLLDRAPDITAIYAQNDLMALGVMSALYGRGLSVPEDCAVVGCDDIPMAKHAIPPLTTVHVPFYETGEAAVRLLLDHRGPDG